MEARLPAARRLRTVPAMYAAAAVLGGAALCVTVWRGLEEPGTALAFGLLVAVGELARVPLPGSDGRSRSAGPLAGAAALGYAMLDAAGGEPALHGAAQVVAVVMTGSLVGIVPHVALGRPPALDVAARTVLGVGFVAVCFQLLHGGGPLYCSGAPGPVHALCLLGLTLLTGLFDAVLGATTAAEHTGRSYAPLLREELRIRCGIVPAIAASGAVLALAVAVAGLWALPVLGLPLLLTQIAFRRHAAVRATHRQTVLSLARVTDISGHTPGGHARRVAALCRSVGRELGLSGRELTVLEYAALLHDVGQLSLVDPVPGGATEPLEGRERRRIALSGASVVRRAGIPGRGTGGAEVADVVERQADPYRQQPVTARVLRTVNAYEELRLGGAGTPGRGAEGALERLRAATAQDHEPRVVEALSRVVMRGRGA